jgi:hypothetical protein
VTGKSFETRIADLVRHFGTDFEKEAINTWGALKRLLAAEGATFTDLGNAIEKLATGGLAEAELQRTYDAAYAKGVEDATRRQFEAESAFGKRADGSYDWERIAVYCQRERERIRNPKEQTFVDDMAARMSFPGREPTENQASWLLARFRRLGGRIK